MQILPNPQSIPLVPTQPHASERPVPLLSPVLAMPRCGIFIELHTVEEASAFLRQHLKPERAHEMDFVRAERLLELAAASPSVGVRQAATVALRDVLKSETMLG